MLAAEREAVAVNEAAAGEDGDGGGAGAHVDQGGAEIGLVVGEHRQSGRVRTRRHGADIDVAALDRIHQVARHRHVNGHHMHIDTEAAPEHAARIADAAAIVERIGDRQRVQHDTAAAQRMPAASGEHTRDVAVAHGRADHVDGSRHQFARGLAGRDRDHHRFKLQAG